jgi:hypothetical protein
MVGKRDLLHDHVDWYQINDASESICFPEQFLPHSAERWTGRLRASAAGAGDGAEADDSVRPRRTQLDQRSLAPNARDVPS